MAKSQYLLSAVSRRRRLGEPVLRFFKKIFGKLDPILLAVTVLLNLYSAVILTGSTDVFGRSRLVMQIGMSVFGFILMTVISHLDYRFIVNRYWVFFLAFSVALLLVTALFGKTQGGNRSWLTVLSVGSTEITVQPSEFIKMTFICTLTNGGFAYVPSALAFEHGQYEVNNCQFEAGCGEEFAKEFIRLLQVCKNKG